MAVLNKANNTTALNLPGAWNENQAPNNTNAGVIGASITGFTTGSTTGTVTFANFLLSSAYQVAGNTYSISGTSTFTLTGPYTPNGATQPYSLYVAPGKRLTYEGPIQINTRAVGSEPISEHILFVDTNGSFEVNASGAGDGRIRIINTAVTAIRKQGAGYVSSGRSATNDSWTAGSLYIDEGEFWLSGFAGTNPIGTNTLYFTPIGAATPTLRFLQNSGPNTTRTLTNAVSVTTRGTIMVDSGFTATMTGTTSGSGTLTIARSGDGNLIWNNTVSCPLNVTGLLSMGTSNNITSSTIIGDGTIAMNSGQLGVSSGIDASGHTGQITGTCSISGGVSTFGSNFTGAVAVNGGNITLDGASDGYVSSAGPVELTVSKLFNGIGGGNSTPVGGAGYAANLRFKGTGAFHSTRTIALRNAASVRLSESASVASPITANTDTETVALTVEDGTTCTYSGAISTNQTSNLFKIGSKGTLVLSSATAASGVAGRTFALNNDSGYDGTIKITGAGFSGASPITLSRGTLHLNRDGSIGFGSGTGLAVSNGATLACSATAAYAAQMSGALTLNAGSTMKFGAP